MSNSTEIAEIGKPPSPIPREEFSVVAGREPAELIEKAAKIARSLNDVVEKEQLYTPIKGKRFVNVDGWSLLASLCGFTIREVSVIEDERGDYTATCELVRLSDGSVVGRGSAVCGVDEPTWKDRPRYARRSMAATRAAGKCCRLALSWIVRLAGYDVTTSEEVEGIGADVDKSLPSPPPVVSDSKPPQAMTIDATATGSNSSHVDAPCDAAQIESIRAAFRELGLKDLAREILSNYGVNKIAELSHAKAQTLLGELSTRQVEQQLSL